MSEETDRSSILASHDWVGLVFDWIKGPVPSGVLGVLTVFTVHLSGYLKNLPDQSLILIDYIFMSGFSFSLALNLAMAGFLARFTPSLLSILTNSLYAILFILQKVIHRLKFFLFEIKINSIRRIFTKYLAASNEIDDKYGDVNVGRWAIEKSSSVSLIFFIFSFVILYVGLNGVVYLVFGLIMYAIFRVILISADDNNLNGNLIHENNETRLFDQLHVSIVILCVLIVSFSLGSERYKRVLDHGLVSVQVGSHSYRGSIVGNLADGKLVALEQAGSKEKVIFVPTEKIRVIEF